MTEIVKTEPSYYSTSVQVGRDIIKDAGFFRVDSDWLNMGDLTMWEKIHYLPHRVWDKIKHVYWEISYGFQRMFKGYDYLDIYEMDDAFVKRYTKILTNYRKNTIGNPHNMTREEWVDILDEMLYHLHYMVDDNIDAELEKGLPEGWVTNGWTSTLGTINEIKKKHKDEFFVLFSKYFYYLWE